MAKKLERSYSEDGVIECWLNGKINFYKTKIDLAIYFKFAVILKGPENICLRNRKSIILEINKNLLMTLKK